jgi:hypothetical protein
MNVLRQSWQAFVAAGVFAILLAGPFVYFALNAAPSSPGIYPELTNDQDFYLSRIQDVRDGYPMGGNTYLAEYKDAEPVQLLVGEWVAAAILDTFDLETADGLILFQFIFPPFIFLLTYAIARSLKAPKPWALIAAVFLSCGSMFFLFARLVSPQFNFIFWLIAVWGLFKLAETPSWRFALFQAFSVGILFYLYPYYWTHIGGAYAILFFAALIVNRPLALGTAVSGIGALIVGSGYAILLFNARALPYYMETLERLGGVYTRFPSGALLALSSLVLVAAVVFIAWKIKRIPPPVLVGLSLVLGGIVAMNQHLITGFSLEFASHYKMQIQFSNVFLALAAMSAFGFWAAASRARYIMAAGAIVLLLSILSVSLPFAEAAKAAQSNGELASYAPVIVWLKENGEPEAVVYAHENLAKIIPAYTAQNVFYARNANLFFMPESEATERAIIQNFRGSFDDAFIMDAERELFGQRYMNRYQHALQWQKVFGWFGISIEVPERIPEAVKASLRARLAELTSQAFEKAIDPYRIDYFVVDKAAPDRLTENDLSFARLVFETEQYAVYQKS